MEHCDGLKMVGMGTFSAVFILMQGIRSTGVTMNFFHRNTSLLGCLGTAKEGEGCWRPVLLEVATA